MCGRLSCCLSRQCLSLACQYRDDAGVYVCPEWCDIDVNASYEPSYNVAPKTVCPVLVSGSKLQADRPPRRVLTAMRWGLVPQWYEGELRAFNLQTANCRKEDVFRKPCYSPAVTGGQRCVAVADGYYEWMKPSPFAAKQPLLVYFRQPAGISMVTRNWDCEEKEKTLFQGGHWQGPKLLTMAAIFDINRGLPSFSILTMQAPEYIAWMRPRAPMILGDEAAVAEWLDPDKELQQLIDSYHFPTTLEWHKVPKKVWSIRNKGVDCTLPIAMQKNKPKATLMDIGLNNSETAGDAGPSTSRRARSRSPLKGTPREEPGVEAKTDSSETVP